jgi:hypothetical protein
MPAKSLHAECIRRAALILGGYAALGQRIGASPHALDWWARENGEVPDVIFLRVVDVLLGEPEAPLRPTPTRLSTGICIAPRRRE